MDVHRRPQQARREHHIDTVFARFGGSTHDNAVERREHIIGYDALIDPPDWIVEHLRRLHDAGRLGTTRVADLATRIVEAGVHLDRHGYLPDGWADVGVHPATREVPVIEVEVPGP